MKTLLSMSKPMSKTMSKTNMRSASLSEQKNGKASAGNNRVFTQVSYREFREQISGIATKNIKSKGYETTIFDDDGNIHAIMHAASIDNHGNCYPAAYFIRTDVLLPQWYQAA